MKRNIRDIPFVAALVLMLGIPVAYAGAIKVWSSYETLTASDLNANFAHIHNTMVGGHGARLVNADVSPSAAIASSKLASGAGIPRSWVTFGTTCTSGTCTLDDSFGVTSVTWTATGQYAVLLSRAGPDNYHADIVTARAVGQYCIAYPSAANAATVWCYSGGIDGGNSELANGAFSLTVLDND